MNSEKPNYFQLVYQVVCEIPPGKVCSYGKIAAYLGRKSGARMVGYAMNAAHTLPDIPAHRVVNRLGFLTGRHHFASPTQMQELLEKEGIEVQNNQIRDFTQRCWDPESDLKL